MAMAVRPGGVFRSAGIAKYVISGPRRSPIYDVEFLSLGLSFSALCARGCVRTYTYVHVDISTLARRPDEPSGDEKKKKRNPKSPAEMFAYENPICSIDTRKKNISSPKVHDRSKII